MPKNRTELIVALDVENYQSAAQLVNCLYPEVKIFKVGSQLFTACGPRVLKMIRRKGAKVFLDLKFHDIPHTVKQAVESAKKLNVFMLTLHLSGGLEMLQAAAGISKRPKLVGVTVLTSQKAKNTSQKVLSLVRLAKRVKLDGVVCSVHEAVKVRRACGKNFLIVTPGIRPKGSAAADQKRVATAADAAQAGADFIVVGRPIIKAADKKLVANKILKELRLEK